MSGCDNNSDGMVVGEPDSSGEVVISLTNPDHADPDTISAVIDCVQDPNGPFGDQNVTSIQFRLDPGFFNQLAVVQQREYDREQNIYSTTAATGFGIVGAAAGVLIGGAAGTAAAPGPGTVAGGAAGGAAGWTLGVGIGTVLGAGLSNWLISSNYDDKAAVLGDWTAQFYSDDPSLSYAAGEVMYASQLASEAVMSGEASASEFDAIKQGYLQNAYDSGRITEDDVRRAEEALALVDALITMETTAPGDREVEIAAERPREQLASIAGSMERLEIALDELEQVEDYYSRVEPEKGTTAAAVTQLNAVKQAVLEARAELAADVMRLENSYEDSAIPFTARPVLERANAMLEETPFGFFAGDNMAVGSPEWMRQYDPETIARNQAYHENSYWTAYGDFWQKKQEEMAQDSARREAHEKDYWTAYDDYWLKKQEEMNQRTLLGAQNPLIGETFLAELWPETTIPGQAGQMTAFGEGYFQQVAEAKPDELEGIVENPLLQQLIANLPGAEDAEAFNNIIEGIRALNPELAATMENSQAASQAMEAYAHAVESGAVGADEAAAAYANYVANLGAGMSQIEASAKLIHDLEAAAVAASGNYQVIISVVTEGGPLADDVLEELRDRQDRMVDSQDPYEYAATNPDTPLYDGEAAFGGPVYAGRTYLVGELGPELFVPGITGSIVPNHRLPGGEAVTHNRTTNISVSIPNARLQNDADLETLARQVALQIRHAGGY